MFRIEWQLCVLTKSNNKYFVLTKSNNKYFSMHPLTTQGNIYPVQPTHLIQCFSSMLLVQVGILDLLDMGPSQQSKISYESYHPVLH